MAPLETQGEDDANADAPLVPVIPPAPKRLGSVSDGEIDEWVENVDEVTSQIQSILDGTITDFDAFDRQLALKDRAKQIKEEEARTRRERFFLYGIEGKGEGTKYKWWCKRCFVEYSIDLPGNVCTRCKQSDQMMTQQARRDELMGKLEVFKAEKTKHSWRKDKWLRWKKSQALLGRSRNINYKAWEYWEPDTDTEEEGEPIVPRDNPEFLALEADMKARQKKTSEKALTASKCRERGNQCMKEGDFVGAIEHYEEGLEYKRDCKALWTNKALAEVKVFRWRDAISSCNKVIEYSEIFEDGFTKSPDACFKAFTRRAVALRALHRWSEALADAEDALKLFPKDKDARDLFEKTKAASAEASETQQLLETPGGRAEKEACGDGAVQGETRESEDEELPKAQPHSLAGLSKQDFANLLGRLKREPAQRALYCRRSNGRGGDAAVGKAAVSPADGRKVKLELIEEEVEPSGLDSALKDAERCCVLWRKSQGKVVPLRADVQHLAADQQEDQGDAAFLRVTAPRVVAVLQVLSSNSDHHCSLTAPAVRHVWPLLSCSTWRQPVLELLLEWSQRTASAKAMAEFVSRNPDPHLKLLLDVFMQETKENLLPPGLEDRAQLAASRLERSQGDLDFALEDMLQGLSMQSPAEIALSTLGNLCLAGQSLQLFKEQLLPLLPEVAGALEKQLRPLNWRLCGRAAGALCNVLRLGDSFASVLQEKCLESLVSALRGECAEDSPASMVQSLCGKGNTTGHLPELRATGRLLGALINLLVVRPSAMQRVLELNVLDLVLPLVDPEADACDGAPVVESGEGGPATTAFRATLLAAKLLGAAPSRLSINAEAELLRRLLRMLLRWGGLFAAQGDGSEALEQLELTVRMLTIVLSKTPGALDRLTEASPRVVELPDGVGAPATQVGPAVSFMELTDKLVQVVVSSEPKEHVSPGEEGSAASRLRGNLALLMAALCDAQAKEGVPPALRELDLSPVVRPFVECLRKERGKVQANVGVCVTRLAKNPRYRQQVRDFNGIESLHQIQLPVVEAQKADTARKHRLETSIEARKTEAARRRQLHPFKGLD